MTSAPDPGRILDAGAGGLTFFAEYLPCAHWWGTATSTSVESLRERYDEQRDLDLATLVADASGLTRLADVLAVRIDEQSAQVRVLPTAWEGSAADGAVSGLDAVVGHGWALQSGVEALSHALTAVAANIGAAVAEKARVAGGFEGRLVDGRTPDEVAAILAGATGEAGGPTPEQVSRWFSSAVGGDPVDTAEHCTRWLEERFVPEIDAAIHAFLRVCDDTDRLVTREFGSLAIVFDRIESGGPGVLWGNSGSAPGSTPPGSAAGGPRSGHTGDPVRAGVDLVVAAAGLAGAVLDLATSGVQAATALLDAATVPPSEPTAPDAEPSGTPSTPGDGGEVSIRAEEQHQVAVPQNEPPPADTASDPPSQDLPTREAEDVAVVGRGDASPPIPASDGEATAPPETQGNGVTPATIPPPSPPRDRSKSSGVPTVVGSDQSVEQPENGDGGVVLAEAGPL